MDSSTGNAAKDARDIYGDTDSNIIDYSFLKNITYDEGNIVMSFINRSWIEEVRLSILELD